MNVHKFVDANYFQFEIINMSNTSKDDTIFLKVNRLPAGMNKNEFTQDGLAAAFKQRLQIIWQSPHLVKDGVFRM